MYAPRERPSMTEPHDWNKCLITIGATQDKSAFVALFKHFTPRVISFLKQGGQIPTETAEELVQEVMIKVWRNAPSFSAEQASASTWIYTIARNTRIDWLRKQARGDTTLLRAEDIYGTEAETNPHNTLVRLRGVQHVRSQLQELPREQSEVLGLMYMGGLSGQQVANALRIPLGTVKSRIRLAMAKLKLSVVRERVLDEQVDQETK